MIGASDGDSLVLGWGNPGRLDDGLGPAFADALRALELPRVTVHSDYQLQVEDVVEIAAYERVIFVDADRGGAEPFSLRRLSRDDGGSATFTTHSLAPNAVLAMSHELFQAEPEAWLLGIRGYEFDDFGEGLSSRARHNLDRAVAYLQSALTANDLHPTPSEEVHDDD